MRKRIETSMAAYPTRETFESMYQLLNDALKEQTPTSGHPLVWALRGRMNLMLRQGALAQSDFERALQIDATHAEAAAWASEYYLAVGQLAQAEACLAPALQQRPQSLVLRNAELSVLTMKQDWTRLEPAAEAVLPLAEALQDAKLRREALSVAYARRAQAQAFQDRFLEAAESYRLSLAELDNPDVRFARGECLERSQRYADAQQEFQSVLDGLPVSPQTEIARQRVTGKLAMIQAKVAEGARQLIEAEAAKRDDAKLFAILAGLRSGELTLYDLDAGNNFWADEVMLGLPEGSLLSQLDEEQRAALHQELDALAAAWRPSGIQQRLEAWLAEPSDIDARAEVLKLFHDAEGSSRFQRIQRLMPPPCLDARAGLAHG